MRVRIAKAISEYLKKLSPPLYCVLKCCNKSEGDNDEEYFITFDSFTEQNLKIKFGHFSTGCPRKIPGQKALRTFAELTVEEWFTWQVRSILS
jgi:hypothetical protein